VNELVEYFRSKKNLINLLSLAVLVLGVPLGTSLARNQQILHSQADVARVQFAGPNVVSRNNQIVATSPTVNIVFNSPYGAPLSGSTSMIQSGNNLASFQVPNLVQTVYAGHLGSPGTFCEDSRLVGEDASGAHYFIEDCADSGRSCQNGQCESGGNACTANDDYYECGGCGNSGDLYMHVVRNASTGCEWTCPSGNRTAGQCGVPDVSSSCNQGERVFVQCIDNSFPDSCGGSGEAKVNVCDSGQFHEEGECNWGCGSKPAPQEPTQPNRICNPGEANTATRSCKDPNSCRYGFEICNGDGTGFDYVEETNCEIGNQINCNSTSNSKDCGRHQATCDSGGKTANVWVSNDNSCPSGWGYWGSQDGHNDHYDSCPVDQGTPAGGANGGAAGGAGATAGRQCLVCGSQGGGKWRLAGGDSDLTECANYMSVTCDSSRSIDTPCIGTSAQIDGACNQTPAAGGAGATAGRQCLVCGSQGGGKWRLAGGDSDLTECANYMSVTCDSSKVIETPCLGTNDQVNTACNQNTSCFTCTNKKWKLSGDQNSAACKKNIACVAATNTNTNWDGCKGGGAVIDGACDTGGATGGTTGGSKGGTTGRTGSGSTGGTTGGGTGGGTTGGGSGGTGGGGSGSTTPPQGTAFFRFAETSAALAAMGANEGWQVYSTHPMIKNQYTFASATPGTKFIYAQFKSATNQVTGVSDNLAQIELVGEDPESTNVACTLDITKSAMAVNITGTNFGNSKGAGQVTVDSSPVSVLDWANTGISASVGSISGTDNNRVYKVQVTRSDGQKTAEGTCSLDTTEVSLGAKAICRSASNQDLDNVDFTITDTSSNKSKLKFKGKLDKNGLITGLPKLQTGNIYKVCAKPQFGLRRCVTIGIEKGTNYAPINIPMGDIYPTSSQDKKINSGDFGELKRQFGAVANCPPSRSGDLNKDCKVNVFDAACMIFDFNKEDDSEDL